MAAPIRGDAFGPRPPPLLEYLQQILRGYSDGQILKELLQNAEDAGASEVKFIYDKRQFGTETLFEPKLEKFQGPALLAFNNAEFSDEDWGAIQRPARSDKKENALKVGRFGIGFSSVYHLTDLPCIISGRTIAIIDPFEEYFKDSNERRVPGSKWNLADVLNQDACSDQLSPFRKAFPDQDTFWQLGDSLKGTLFRFPLRKSPSKLCSSVYTDEKIKELLDSFRQDALVVMLFLRNVERISVLERKPGSNQPSPYLDIKMTSKDMSNFRSLRKDFSESLERRKGPQEYNKDIEMSVKLDVKMDDPTRPHVSQTWISCQVIANNCSKQLKDLADRLHFLPWVGVAISLTEENTSEDSLTTNHQGRIFCFLPLPHGEASQSGLPVHVHGYFGVSDDRRSLKWPGGDQIQNETALWNKLLVEEVLPGVYLKAVLEAIDVCRKERKRPDVIYNALPDIGSKLGNWEGMVKLFYKEIFKHPVLYVETQGTWEYVGNVIVDDLSGSVVETPPVVVKSLRLGGFLVAENLPRHVLKAIKQPEFVQGVKFVNAQRVLSSLRSQSLDHYEYEERLDLITYLLNNKCTPQDLNNLELLPIGGGRFTKFIANPKSEDIVHIPTNQCQEELLPHLKHRFVGSLTGEFRELHQHLTAMARSDLWKQLQELSPRRVVSLLKETLPREWKGEHSIKTILDERTGIFSRSWLKTLWEFACRHVKLTELEGLNLLPVTDLESNPIELVTLKQGSKIISCSSVARSAQAEVVTVLSRLGIFVCEFPLYVTNHFDLTMSNFAQQFDSNGVMCTLRRTDTQVIERLCQNDPEFREKFQQFLLPFLNCFLMTQQDKNFVKNLRIFQACNKIGDYSFTSISSGVGLLEKGCERHLPAVTLPRMLMITEQEVVRSFCRQMGVKELKEADVVKDILVSFQGGRFSANDKKIVISWIGTSFQKIRQTEGNLRILQSSLFVPNGANQERRPCDLFDPSDDLLKSLLSDDKFFPNKFFLQANGGVWRHILAELGYLTRNNVNQYHLKVVADEIVSQRKQDQADALCRFVSLKSVLLRSYVDSYRTLANYLRDVPFVRCRRERPVNYPRHLPFYGESAHGTLFTPGELVAYSEKNWQLSGSSALLTEETVEEIGIRMNPSVAEVSKHLRSYIEHFSVPSHHDTSMIHAIYNFLNNQANQIHIASYLPKKWIWTGEGFTSPENACLEDTAIDLRPFVFAIPREYRDYRRLYKTVQISANVTTKDLLQLLKKVKTELELKEDVNRLVGLATRILRRLLETEANLKEFVSDLYVPTESNELLPSEEVSFCDYNWLKYSQLTGEEASQAYSDIKLISEQFSIPMARRLGVVPLSSRLAMADEIVEGISQTGQYEAITTRIRNILSDAGYQSTSIPKEMIQNAEDAGATEVRFLIDLRSNEGLRERLLDQGMKSWQGAALWVYNDAVFSDSDLENITKLGGGTKTEDASKIGKFGLGFNSIYHITDVPSFVTRHFINFFDPHRKFLESQIRRDGRGIRLDFQKNPSVTVMFRDQFQPYDGIFNCHLSGTSPKEYPATLFRLPLRGAKEAVDSEICKECYTESKFKLLMKSICDTSNQLLLFTENVRSIEIHLLKEGDGGQPTLLFSARKDIVSQTPTLSIPFRKVVHENVQDASRSMPPDTVTEINVVTRWTDRGKQYFQESSKVNRTEEWVMVMSAGKGTARSLCRGKVGIEAGVLPCGGIAWKKSPPSEKMEGQVFCGLPLSVPDSHLPVHINGSFALSEDRAKLWQDSSLFIDTQASFKSKWNVALFEDVILSAYLTFLEQGTVGNYCIGSDEMYHLWPNLNETSTNGDYGKLVLSFYAAVAKGLERQRPPSIFWDVNQHRRLSLQQIAFLDERFETNEKEFRVASDMITREGKALMVLKLPQHINDGFKKASCSDIVAQQSYSFARLFREIFLPNLGISRDEDNLILQFALAECESEVLSLMKEHNCIPAGPGEESFKKPSDLFDPSALGDLFSEEEGYFPSYSFLKLLNDRQKGTLRDIGSLKTSLQWTDLVDRASTIADLWTRNKNQALHRFKSLMMTMERKLGDSAPHEQSNKEILKAILFIPTKDHHGHQHLKCANEVFLKTEEDLVGTVSFIVDCEIPCRVKEFLDLGTKKPPPKLVLENLSNLGKGIVYTYHLPRICSKMYTYLQDYLHVGDVVFFLRTSDCFLVEETFVSASKLSFTNDSVPPYMYKVSSELRRFGPLLEKANVKNNFDEEDLIKVLNDVQGDYFNQPLPKEILDDVLTKVVKPLANKIETSKIDSTEILLPDAEGVLSPSSKLAFCDVEWLNAEEVVLCHKDIPSSQAIRLGVRDIRHQLLENCSEVIPGYLGEDFGQREELTSRLQRILSGYPCDFCILKELVQNADDAGASEIHFILDKGNYPTKRLLKDSMKNLQGPALLAFNNKPFTEEDIRGIQKLGEGSKREATDKTGRYGVGFNVVYHLTDCPMFMTEGHKICVMDPTLRFVPGATVKSPGRMYNNVHDGLLKVCPDFLEPFLTFCDQLQIKTGTLFRFPLRKEESELSNEEWTPQKVQGLLDEFKDEMFDALLFLKNVRKISISIKEKECKELKNTYTVEVHLSDEGNSERMAFYKHLSDHANTPIMRIPCKGISNEVLMKNSEGYEEQWLVQQSIGLGNQDIPLSISTASQSGRADMKFLPKGGVAARLSSKCAEPTCGLERPSRKVESKAFCFLPLPLSTSLPVHVDGYFALDHEARRNLWYGPTGDPKNDWNRLIKERVIARAYVQLLLRLKDWVIKLIEENNYQCAVKTQLRHFHTIFPQCDLQNKSEAENPWNCVSKEVYKKIMKEKYDLFPVIRSLPTTDLDYEDVVVTWKSCMEDTNEPGYFDDLSRTFTLRPTSEKEKNDWEVLQELLLKLEFPLLSTPLSVYYSLVSASEEGDDSSTNKNTKGVLKISSDSVIHFLKEKALFSTLKGLPKNLKETPIKTGKQLDILLRYVKIAEKYETKLDGLPLLLTGDGILRTFSTIDKVFSSVYQTLLRNCKNEFLHEQFRYSVSEECDVFAKFQITDLSERLDTELSEAVFCSGDLVPWSHGPPKRTNITPSVEWLRHFWKYLSSKEANFKSQKAFVEHCTACLGKWALIPVTVKEEQRKDVTYLIPILMGKAVLSRECYDADKDVYGILVKLQTPVLDLDVIRPETTFSASYSLPVDTFYQITKKFVSKIENREQVLPILDRLLKMNSEGFAKLTKSQCSCILEHMGKGSIHLVKTHGDSLLKRLPCYETIQGTVVKLDRKTYSIAMSDLPTEGNEIWLNPSNSIFLKKDKLPSELSKALNLEELNEVELYRKFILPYFTYFPEKTMWYHLERIMNMVLAYHLKTNEREDLVRRLDLPEIPLAKSQSGQIKVARELFDPDHDVFSVMLTKDCFPVRFKEIKKTNRPDHEDQEAQWLRFLRLIGMKTEVTSSQFLKFVEDVSVGFGDPHDPDEKRKAKMQRDCILFKHFGMNHNLHNDDDLLDKLSKVPFISSHPPDKRLCKLFVPVSVKKVTTKATLASKRSLVWSIEPLCPDWVNASWDACDGGSNGQKNCMKRWKEKLGINAKPKLTVVLRHTQTLCNALAFSDNVEGKAVTLSTKTLLDVIIDILKFLSSQCENVSKNDDHNRGPQRACSNTVNCCRNCKLIVEQLESVPFVPVDGCKVLTKANMVVKNMITEENCDIFLYLKKLPDELVPYFNTLQCIGATEQPTLEQYARVLEAVSATRDVTSDPNLIAAAKQAMWGLLRCLHRKQHDEKTSQILSQMTTLYLMSKSEEEPIVRSSSLFYNDVAQFNKRLSEFPHPLLKAISPAEVGTSVNVDELLKTLPEHLRPRFISECVKERMVSSVNNAIEQCTSCSISRKLRKIMSWEQLPVAIQCIVSHELKTGSTTQAEDKIEELMRSRFKIKCINKLETTLFFEGRGIPQSQSDTSSLFVKNQVNSEIQEIVVYISHDANPLNIHRNLAKNLNDIFKLVRDTSYLELILRAENEDDLSNLLNSEGIGTAGLEEESFWNLPELGSNIQDDVIALLNQDIMYIFFPNEYVGYDCGEGDDELLIYAKVLRRTEDEISSERPWRVNYEVQIGQEEIRTIPAHKLYKFTKVDHPDRYALTVYNGPAGDSAEGNNGPGVERAGGQTDEPLDLNATKEQVTKILQDIMTMPKADRQKTIRRLLLKWHPDKNSSHKQFAEEVFKHIQRELDRLQNVNTSSSGNFYDDVHQRARRYEEDRRHWQNQYRASSSSRKAGGRRHREDHDFNPPPSFHRKRNTLEGRRHLKQARVDFEVAERLENSTFCCQWKCQLYFFASEKAIKAAQLSSGRNTSSESGILKAAESFKDELDLTDSVRSLIDIVQKDSHYPDSFPSPSVPQSEFTPEQANAARECTRDILTAVGRLIQGEED